MIILFKLKRFCFFIIFLSLYNVLSAQELSVRISPGIMNYGGDLQTKVYTFQNANFSIAADVMYRVDKFSLRGGITYGKVNGNDLNNTSYKDRNLSFFSNIADANLCLQYDFF